MQTAPKFEYPTQFTVAQLEKLRELVMRENSAHPNQELHNLGGKLASYVDDARFAVTRQLRMVG